jgi:exopolyphosphatase/guanosine-5'-triphosphate,3'-diphosphate pyrophosphatase
MIVNTAAVSKGKKEIRACIDLGSTYFRLLVVRGESVHPSSVYEERVFVGWGRELASSSEISEGSISRAIEAVAGLIKRASGLSCDDPMIVATNTLRSSSNREEILGVLEGAVGKKVHVLSQRGEAELGFIGASSLFAPGDPLILVDPGGTSTEFAWGSGAAVEGYFSIPWGTHTVEIFSERLARERLKDELERTPGYSSLPAGGKSHRIAFTGGSAVSISIVSRFMRGRTPLLVESRPIDAGELRLVGRRMRKLIAAGRGRILPIARERVQLLIPGLVLVETIVDSLAASSFQIVTRDLRWGVVSRDGEPPWGCLADE